MLKKLILMITLSLVLISGVVILSAVDRSDPVVNCFGYCVKYSETYKMYDACMDGCHEAMTTDYKEM